MSNKKKCKCGFFNHCENESTLFECRKHKKIKVKTLDNLISNKLLAEISRFMCNECFSKNIDQNADKFLEKKFEENIINVTDTENGSIDISNELEYSITKDITSLYKMRQCSDTQYLKNYNAKDWLDKRPAELVEHVSRLCNLNADKDENSVQLAQCIESIYDCRNKLLVLPQSFRQNLLTYSVLNSKLLVNLNNQTRPAGSYTYMGKSLENHSQNEIEFPSGLVRVVFDNVQKVGKRYTVRADNSSVPLSVVTSMLTFVLTKTTYHNLMKRSNLPIGYLRN